MKTEIKKRKPRDQDVISTHLEQGLSIAKQETSATLLFLCHNTSILCNSGGTKHILNIHLLPNHSKILVSVISTFTQVYVSKNIEYLYRCLKFEVLKMSYAAFGTQKE